MDQPRKDGVSRRDFLKGIGAGVMTSGLLGPSAAEEEAPAKDSPPSTVTAYGPSAVPITLKVNGQTHTLQLEPRVTLLNALRNHLGLTGAKNICDRGECGGCTVLVNGEPRYACMMLAIEAQGQEITTVEGLLQGEELHPIQAAFVEHDALQCGFCTPGFVMSVAALLEHNPNPTLEEVRQGLSGNTCRCGAYARIFEAALTAARRMRGEV